MMLITRKPIWIACLLAFLFSCTFVFAQRGANIELANEYFSNGEFEKAYELYKELAKSQSTARIVHKKYLETMIALKMEDKALKYLKKMVKVKEESELYNIDYAELLKKTGQASKAEKHYDNYFDLIKKNDNRLRFAAREFIQRGIYDQAERAYMLGRKNGYSKFSYELANLYWMAGKKEKMIDEYLSLIKGDKKQLNYVQNVLQARLSEDEEYKLLEYRVLEKIQNNPTNISFNELLVWLYLQEKKFYLAFMQSKAIDNRLRLEGFNIFDIGRMAYEHKDYKNAIKIFEYLSEKYRQKSIYPMARNMLVKTKEEYIKNTYPIDLEKIKSLVEDYQEVVDEIGKTDGAEALLSMAQLQAFYLNDKTLAINILEDLLRVPGLDRKFVSKSKLILGDIYLLKDEPWESILLYAQVQKTEKDKHLGHWAKLKNAKLSYYTGDFELAKSHLDILKLATSREISNDAMDLSLLIQDNLDLDTTANNMKRFAATELLEYQNKVDEALVSYQKLFDELAETHSLKDEILMRKAEIYAKKGDFKKQEEMLLAVLDKYKADIWGDDANFFLAELYENKLKDEDKAMEYYKKQMLDFPGSVYVVEARKRYRIMRGDKL